MTLAEQPAPDGLTKVGGRPPLPQYLAQVWGRREFIYSLAKFRLEAENGRNRLGIGWVVLKPLINAAVYGTVFGVLLGRGARADNYIMFLIIGVFLFEFFASCFTSGSKSITSNSSLVQSLSFPRMALPLALVAQRLMQLMPMLAIMTVFVLASGTWPQWQWFLMVPLIVIFTVFNTGLALITARLTVHFRDLTQLLPFVARFFFYTSGVFFSIENRFNDNPIVLRIADFQPIHEFMSLGRAIMLDGPEYVMPTQYWLYGSIWALITVTVGTVFFWAAEERYGRTD